jgi:hypothetical protein
MVLRNPSPTFRPNLAGFFLLDLLAVLAILLALISIWFKAITHARERNFVIQDLANVRQILRASAIYSSENNDYLAHPTWGSDLTGPDGWAYLTSNRNKPVPGALQSTPGSCANVDLNSRQFTNQLAYFKVGQVSQYLPSVQTAWCPKDVATRRSEPLHRRWLSRPVKVTSYCWNASIGGYTGPKAKDLLSRTYKISQFLPTDWLMWDQDESNGFYFNDAASNPATPGEALSLRHSGVPNWWTRIGNQRNLPGGGVIGTFGGSAELVNFRLVYDLISAKIPAPNFLLNGPGYQ